MLSRLRVTAWDEPGWNYGLWRSAFHDVTEALGASYAAYNQRVVPATYGRDRYEEYWSLHRGVVMTDVSAEKTTEITGSDAEKLMDRVMPRAMSSFRPGRAMYGVLCRTDGGVLCDGVLVRLGSNRFWYVGGQGDAESWLLAHAKGFDVDVNDPDVSVLSIQGPRDLDVLAAACDGGVPDKFTYFTVANVVMGGQRVLITRTGWTGELGFEVYVRRGFEDGPSLWHHLEQAGAPFGITVGALDAMDIRRIEAGILLCGSDMDVTMNPFQAGLGDFIDLDKPEFVGKAALEHADRTLLLRGLLSPDGEPVTGGGLYAEKKAIGRVTAAAYSPYLESGTALVRLRPEHSRNSNELLVDSRAGGPITATFTPLPMYDHARRIVRGLDAPIP